MRSYNLATLIVALPFTLAAQSPAPAGAPARAPAATAAFPSTPVGRALDEWLNAFNSADSVRLAAYYRTYGLQRSIEAQMARRAATGGFELVSVERNEPRRLEFVVRERDSGTLAYGVSELAEDNPRLLKQSALMPIPAGLTAADLRIDAATRRQVIDSAVAKLDANYVFPHVARAMADTVRARLARGAYDDAGNGLSFALRLTDDFREVSRDRHLGVNFNPRGVPAPRQGPPDADARERYRQQVLRDNCGFVRSEKLDGNVGYLKFNFFGDPDVCGEVATKAFVPIADARALIIDLRDNGGGSPGMVAYVSSYLFSQRTHLTDIWERPTDRIRQFWTNPDVHGRKLADDVPVYVLTSSRTFSGAEEFSYNLRNLKRATIVGETTGGGAHPVSGHRIHDKFSIGVPFARAINPITKTNWEGTGVEPHVKVPASDALSTALKLIADGKVVP